jgi:hypothetical protein
MKSAKLKQEIIMEEDQNVSLWEVKLPINGLISIEQDEIRMGDVTLRSCKDGFLAKTVVTVSREDMIRNEATKRVNKALDKIAFETDASIRIVESWPIIANQVGKHVEKTTGEVIDSIAYITIKLIRPTDEETLSEAAKLGSNIQDNAKKTFQRSLSHYRNGLNAEFDRNPKAFLDFWTSIEIIAGKYGKKGGNGIKDKIYYCCEKFFGEGKEDEVKKLYKIRIDVAHGLRDVSDPEEIKIMIEKTPQIKDLARRFLNFWSKKIDMTRKSRID